MNGHCPTVGVCPPCREGWGHWSGTEYVPTVESTIEKSRQRMYALAAEEVASHLPDPSCCDPEDQP